jgi:hypothetical protein
MFPSADVRSREKWSVSEFDGADGSSENCGMRTEAPDNIVEERGKVCRYCVGRAPASSANAVARIAAPKVAIRKRHNGSVSENVIIPLF